MSFGEISLIFVLTLVVFGPKQLPTIAAHIGLFIGRIRRSYDKLKQEIYHHSGMAEINKVKLEMDDLYSTVRHSLVDSSSFEDGSIYDDDFLSQLPIYYQPELDFEREPELFDEASSN